MERQYKWTCRVAAILCLGMIVLLEMGCNEDDNIMNDPYSSGREPLKVKLLDKTPSPEAAAAQETVTFYASGLENYCHKEENKYDFEFYIADERATVLEATDSTVTIRVPDNVSSGLTYMVLEEQIFYGPNFKILGSVSIDEGYSYYKKDGKIVGPYSGTIYNCLPWCKNTEQVSGFYMAGDFRKNTDLTYRWGGLAFVKNKDGLIGYNKTDFKLYDGISLLSKIEEGADGFLHSVKTEVKGLSYMDDKSNPRVLVYGSFEKVDNTRYKLQQYNNLLLMTNDFQLECENKQFRDSKGIQHTLSVPKFLGGIKEPVLRSWSTSGGKKIVAVGNLTQHILLDYENSSCNIDGDQLYPAFKYTSVGSVLRMDEAGNLDETYRIGDAFTGVGGNIMDACRVTDESAIIVGEMYSFDGKPVPNIVKLNADGIVDEEFLSNIGTGADGAINRVCYYQDKVTGKDYVVLVGAFNYFNGKECWGLAVINSNGEFDSDFVIPRPQLENGTFGTGIEGGRPNFAKIVDINGKPKMVVSGSFTKYGGITRRGFLILELTGEAIQGFNVAGEFSGQLYDAEYSLTSDNANGLLLVGDFMYFDGKRVNNVIMLKLELDDKE